MATMLTPVQSAELTRSPREPDPQVPERAHRRRFSAFYKNGASSCSFRSAAGVSCKLSSHPPCSVRLLRLAHVVAAATPVWVAHRLCG
jgi:hypothetical protein